jgi:hypothetical protein
MTDYDVVGRGVVYHKELYRGSHLFRVCPSFDNEGNYSQGLNFVTRESHKGNINRFQLLLVYLHLLICWEVYDVSRTSIINKHSSGEESSDGQYDDKCVVMWIVDVSCVVFAKRDHLVVHLQTLP